MKSGALFVSVLKNFKGKKRGRKKILFLVPFKNFQRQLVKLGHSQTAIAQNQVEFIIVKRIKVRWKKLSERTRRRAKTCSEKKRESEKSSLSR